MTGIIVVDKPSGWTSQDVCAKLRGLAHERRVGHSGTLDPMATGVLPVFFGRATRGVEFAESDSKRYTAAMRVGISTDTQDITGALLRQSAAHVAPEDILELLPEFTGEILQTPPMYSAVKVGGRRLYELARSGRSVERAARRVTIHSIALTGREGEDFILDIHCSKGTYIRTLIADIGERLGCGAAMSALRRTAVGAFTLGQSHTMEELVSAAESGGLESLLIPVESLFDGLLRVTTDREGERRARNGSPFPAPDVPDGRCLVYSEDGEFLLLGEAERGTIKTIKSFFDPSALANK